MNAELNSTNNTMNQSTNSLTNAERHVLNILKVSDFSKFLQDISERFEVSIEDLLPNDYDLRHIDNVEYIEHTLLRAVMYNLFKSFEKRNFLTEYIAYTNYSVDNVKIFFMGAEIYDIQELANAESFLYRDRDPKYKENLRENFKALVSTDKPFDVNDYIAFKFKSLNNIVNNNNILDGSVVYYVSVNRLKYMSRQEFDDVVKTYFDNRRIVIISGDTTHFQNLQQFLLCNRFNDIYNIIHNVPSHKEKRVFVFNYNSSDEDFDGSINDLSDDDFIRYAEEDGRIYLSVENFINAFNAQEVCSDCDYARIIEVECFDEE